MPRYCLGCGVWALGDSRNRGRSLFLRLLDWITMSTWPQQPYVTSSKFRVRDLVRLEASSEGRAHMRYNNIHIWSSRAWATQGRSKYLSGLKLISVMSRDRAIKTAPRCSCPRPAPLVGWPCEPCPDSHGEDVSSFSGAESLNYHDKPSW